MLSASSVSKRIAMCWPPVARGVALEVGLNENANQAVIAGARHRGHDLKEPVSRRAVQRHGRALCGTFRLELQSLEPRPYTDVVHELNERCGDVHLLGLLTRGSRQCARQCKFTEGRNIDVERVGARGFLGKLEHSHDAAALDVQQPEASGRLDCPAPASGRLHLASDHMTRCACHRALDAQQHARDIPRRNATELRVISGQPDSENGAHWNSLIRPGRHAWRWH